MARIYQSAWWHRCAGLVAVALTCVVIRPVPLATPASRDTLHLELSEHLLTARFMNRGAHPIRILKPMDGSEWGWTMPHYRLIVVDQMQVEVPMRSRCGIYGFPYSGTTWPDDYLITIPAGGVYEVPMYHNHRIDAVGTYHVTLEYRFDPDSNTTPSGDRYPDGLWIGQVTSKTIQVELRPE